MTLIERNFHPYANAGFALRTIEAPINSSADSYREMPWKNGGGMTHEMLRSDDSPQPGRRISLASIDRDGAFSDFGGYERTILSVAGA